MPILRHIYDSATGTHVDVEVTQEVYDCYRRTAWNIQKNDQRFYAKEIQFSSLLGGADGAFENFSEFYSLVNDPQRLICDVVIYQEIAMAFQMLPPDDQHILWFLAIKGFTEREYAGMTGLPQKTVNNRKVRAAKRLRQITQKL